MAMGGIDYLFFTSGSEIMFFQEAISKAHANGRVAPRQPLVSIQMGIQCEADWRADILIRRN
jgi:hypothetical protein